MDEQHEITPEDIHERAMKFGVRAVGLFRHLQKSKDQASIVIGRQFLRSALSVGANLTEADAAESKADFVHKCSIAQKEARESWYWLRVMRRAEILKPSQLDGITNEANQITAIVTSIARNAKRRVKV